MKTKIWTNKKGPQLRAFFYYERLGV